MRFCTNCGNQLDDQAAFCTNCGTAAPAAPAPQAPVAQEPVYQQPVAQEPVYQQPAAQEPVYQQPVQQAPGYQQPAYQQPAYQAPAQPAKKNPVNDILNKATDVIDQGIAKVKKTEPKKLIILGAAVVAVIAVIIVAISLLGGGYKKPIDDYIDIMTGKASKTQIKRMYPTEVWEYYEDEWDVSFEDRYEEYEDGIDDLIDELEDEYGKNIKVTYKIRDKEEWDEDDLDDLRERLNDEYDIKESSVKKAYEVDVKMTIKGRDDDDSEKTTFDIVKIGGKWYLLNF